ncbi:hypothetical protein ACXU4B_10930 [Dyella soli]|uniref:Uncharacterized protein n=1 Tax=Dyella soli TaxID=522319 RepID=A0A4R0YGF7_9GAMM|nr:hypothetical protein [Dyella soli]TCI07314.1 hypothetical protein EZM97_32490 [Dyella soli]
MNAVVSSVIDLGIANDFVLEAEDALEPEDASTHPKFLSSLDLSDEQLRCASEAMTGYDRSHNEGFKAAADTLQISAKTLLLLNGKFRQYFIAELNGEFTNEKAGDKATRMAKLSTSYQQTSSNISKVAFLSVMAIREFESPDSTKDPRLAITIAQRDAINRRLKGYFPAVTVKPQSAKTADTYPKIAIWHIYVELNEKGFQMHDQPYTKGRLSK